MANNRTEAKAAVTAAIVPAVSNAQHITLLNDEINGSTIFRKDVIGSETEAGGNVTIDYANKETATVTTAVNLAVSFTNIENGDVRYLVITKAATNTLTFAGAVNITNFQRYIDVNLTSAPYVVYNKNGVIYVNALIETIIEGLVADITAAEEFKFATCKAVNEYIPAHGAWQTPSYVNNHSAYTTGDFSGLLYRKLTNGMLQIAGSFQRSVVTTGVVFTLDAGFRPAQTLPIVGRREDNTLEGGSITSAGVVTIFLSSSVADDHMDLNIIMPLDLTV